MSSAARSSELARFGAIGFVFLSAACGAPRAPLPVARTVVKTTRPAETASPAFAEATLSPRYAEGSSGLARELEQLCGRADDALAVAASELMHVGADAAARTGSELPAALRRLGVPYVWPRAWIVRSSVSQRPRTKQRMLEWLASFEDGGERRCGVAVTTSDDEDRVSVIAVDVLADLHPLPLRVRPASWMEVSAELLVASWDAKVVVLGPTGLPRSLPTTVDGGRVRAQFNADQPGPWSVQVLADVGGGPRPIIEAALFVGVEPGFEAQTPSSSGEAAAASEPDPERALELMLGWSRGQEKLPPLRRDPELDALAREHAASMRAAQRLGHDIGAGDPARRLERSGVGVGVISVGENVAHASSVVRAQRTLWASPSHRSNLLSHHFDMVGIGVAIDEDESVWVSQLFARSAP